MFDKPTALHTIGLELDSSILRGAKLSQSRGKPSLDSLFDIDIGSQPLSTESVNPLNEHPDSHLLYSKINKHLAVTTLTSDEVLVRTLDLKLKKEADIDSVLSFQAEPLLPYPVENAILDRIITTQTEEGSQLSLLVARKDRIQQHIETWKILNVEPEIISCVPVALAFFSKQFSPSTAPHFVLHLGKTETTCVLVQNGKLLAAQTSHTGLNALTHALTEEVTEGSNEQLNSIDFSKISQQANPLLFAAVDGWRLEITRLLYALSKQLKEEPATGALLTGEGAAISNLGETLCQTAQKQILSPIESPQFAAPASDLQRYAIPIGAALSGLPSSKDQVNFRQQELAFPHPWRRLKKPLAIYFGSCLALALAIYLFGVASAGQKEDTLRQEYVGLLASMNKSYDAVEKEYAAKMHIKLPSESIPPVTQLSLDDIGNRLQFLQKDLKDTPDAFPLQPNVPRVSDVLAWLSTHPNVISSKDASGNIISPLQIDNFTYTMVKRPEIKKPQEKYQVKVEIDFSTPTPKLAREFHDALIAPNDLVDPKGEVKWSTNKNKYKTSFFLKDKTVYQSSAKSGG